MEFGKCMAVSAFDWDDTALIKEYDRIMKTSKAATSKSRRKEKDSDEKKKMWKIGDYCRAVYQEDGLPYEANIIDICGDMCTVDFLGYDDTAEVPLDSLEESNGKKARAKQRTKAKKTNVSNCATDTDHSSVNRREANNTTRMSDRAEYIPQVTYEMEGQETLQHYNYNDRPPHAEHMFPLPPPPSHFLQHNMQPRMGTHPFPCGPAPPLPCPPPMPSCPSIAKNPSLSSMLVSWYMAGYYTGLHENDSNKSHCSKPRCCDRRHCSTSNCCDHHCY